MITNSNKIRFPIDFLESISGLSIILVYKGNVRTSDIMACLSSDAHSYFQFP